MLEQNNKAYKASRRMSTLAVCALWFCTTVAPSRFNTPFGLISPSLKYLLRARACVVSRGVAWRGAARGGVAWREMAGRWAGGGRA